MRINIVAPPPWAHSGYGRQCDLASQELIKLGHEVAITCYAGVHEERERNGAVILGTGGKPYGNGVIAGNYQRWGADLLILLTDIWVINPGQLAGLTVMPWIPVDTEQLGVMDRQWLTKVNQTADLWPVAMSQHGQRLLREFGLDAPVVPHATTFAPDRHRRAEWRAEQKIPDGCFLIVKVGVNDTDDRKAYEVTLPAFGDFTDRHRDVALWCHCEPQAAKAPNLAYMAVQLGLTGRVCFPGEYERGADLYDLDWMHRLYCAADVVDMATKGEGFGVPAIEALACGTPVIGCRNSAMTEKIRPDYGWLIGGQRTWARHHNAWWIQPDVDDLTRAYEKAWVGARLMRGAAALAGQQWTTAAMSQAWAKALAEL